MFATIQWELRQRKTAIFWWSLTAAILVGALFLVFPPIRDQANQLNKVINTLPAAIRGLKDGGSTSASANLGDPVSFLNSQVYYITLPIVLIILSITRASGLLGKDEQTHTLELLLSRPISRGKLLAAKALSGVIETAIVAAVATLVAVLFARLVGMDIAIDRLVLVNVYVLLFSLSYGAITFALNALGRLGGRASTAIAVFVSFGGYVLASLSGLTHYLINPAKFAPYHYFAPDKIMHGQSVGGLNIYLVGIFIVTAVVSYFGFRRRDIQ